MQKRPLAAHSESCLDLQKNALNSAIFGPILKIFVHTHFFGMLETHFWQKIENRPKIAKFTVYNIYFRKIFRNEPKIGIFAHCAVLSISPI